MVSPARAEAHLYLHDCLDEICMTGSTTFDEDNFSYLKAAYDALVETVWHDVEHSLPEAFPHNEGKLIIPCLVAVAPPRSQPKRKPRVTVCQRQWNDWTKRWEWSRGLKVIMWREVPEV